VRTDATMPIAAAEIERLIKQGIPDAKVEIVDLAGDDNHFAAVVISSQFAGKSKLQQHQLVYKALGQTMGGALHALQLQTSVPK
jgi:stress-induced morphogen